MNLRYKAGAAAALPCNIVATATNLGIEGLSSGDLTVRYRAAGGNVTAKALQAGDVTELAAGAYEIQFSAAELATAGLFFYWVEASGAHVYPGLVELVAYTQDEIGAKTALLSTGSAGAIAPVASGGDVTMTIGADYHEDDSREIALTDAGDWPVLDDTDTLTWRILCAAGEITLTGELVAGDPQQVRATPTAAETGAFQSGTYDYALWVTRASGRTWPLASGSWTAEHLKQPA